MWQSTGEASHRETWRTSGSIIEEARRIAVLLLVAAAGVAGTSAAVAGTAQDETVLASRASGGAGAKGNGASGGDRIAVSADGRRIAFESRATNLHPDDTDTLLDLFVRDTEAGKTLLASRATGAASVKGNGASSGPALSDDGGSVAFESFSTNLHPADTDAQQDTFLRDLVSQQTVLVSRASGADGAKGDGPSVGASVSADGRYVAFHSSATNLHRDDTDTLLDVYVRDLVTHQTVLVSRTSGAAGAKGDGPSRRPSISADGRYIAFASTATNLHPDDPDTVDDVYVRDLVTHQTILVSRASGAAGSKGNFQSQDASISDDGRLVAFDSFADNLHPADDDVALDVYVRDLDSGQTRLVSRASGVGGATGNNHSVLPSIAGNGRLVAFHALATNLHPDDTDTLLDVFARDLETGETHLVSRASGAAGVKGNGDSFAAAVSTTGIVVAFESFADNLHPDDTDADRDVLARGGPDTIFADGFESGNTDAWTLTVDGAGARRSSHPRRHRRAAEPGCKLNEPRGRRHHHWPPGAYDDSKLGAVPLTPSQRCSSPPAAPEKVERHDLDRRAGSISTRTATRSSSSTWPISRRGAHRRRPGHQLYTVATGGTVLATAAPGCPLTRP